MGDTTSLIRPAAVLTVDPARRILHELAMRDVSRGGCWNATPGLWQRFAEDEDEAEAGADRLIGTVATVYGPPAQLEITIFRATVTAFGLDHGWTVERLCDDALQHAGLTLAACPRADLVAPPLPDPYRREHSRASGL